jgi:hypothetical protein
MAPGPAFGLAEVRFSLPDLLRDVQNERNTSAMASDKIDQAEIAKLFQKNRTRRVTRARK